FGRAFGRACPCALVALFAVCPARAQTSSPFGNTPPPGFQSAPQPAGVPRQPTSPTPPAQPPADGQIIARVEGRPITQAAFDRIAAPYFARLRAQLGDNFKDEVLRSARQNVLDE